MFITKIDTYYILFLIVLLTIYFSPLPFHLLYSPPTLSYLSMFQIYSRDFVLSYIPTTYYFLKINIVSQLLIK